VIEGDGSNDSIEGEGAEDEDDQEQSEGNDESESNDDVLYSRDCNYDIESLPSSCLSTFSLASGWESAFDVNADEESSP